MDVKELYNSIDKGTLSDDLMVWKLEDDSSWFMAKQYIKKIAENKHLNIKYIDSIKDIPESSGFVADDGLYILRVEDLSKLEYDEHPNLIIVCNKTNKKNNVIVIPKIEEWQFIDHIRYIVPGLSENDVKWLMTQYQYTYDRETKINYFRFENDMEKISIFPESFQQRIFEELYKGGEYSDLSPLTIFDLSNALLRNDKKGALEVLKVFDYIDSKPSVWLLSILLNNFKKVIDIQLNSLATAKDLGLSDKQFYVVKKYNCNVYSKEKLISIYEMLTELEYKYKFEGLPTDLLPQYIVCEILGG